jgi:putative Mg2+ transporter-C (MgtC) family protein
MSTQEILLRMTAAALLGCLVGLERHRADKAAGMRTHMLVGLGSALFMIVSAYGFDRVLRPEHVVLDPSRIAAQVVSGIGFLGAGTILRRNTEIHGLTTAASVWAVSAVGLAAGGGLYLAAIGATALILVILTAIRPLEDRIASRNRSRTMTIRGGRDEFSATAIESFIRQVDLELVSVRSRRDDPPSVRRLDITIGRVTGGKLLALLEHVQAIEGVLEVSYEDHPGES